MRIQFGATIKNRLGEDLLEFDQRNPEKPRKVTLGDVCCMVLDQQMQEDKNPKDKMRRGDLIEQISEADESLVPLNLLESDREMIKDRILRSNLSASVSRYAVRLLDTEAMEDKHASETGKRGSKAGNAQVQARTAAQREQQGSDSDGSAASHSDSLE